VFDIHDQGELVSLNVLASTLGTVAPTQDESHFPPSPEIFWQPLFSIGSVSITRVMVVVAISVALLATLEILRRRGERLRGMSPG